MEHKEKVSLRMVSNHKVESVSAVRRFAAWLVALRTRHEQGTLHWRPEATALDVLARDLPCQKSGGLTMDEPPCPGVVVARLGGGREQPFSFPCPCKQYGSTLSKADALALVALPWEAVARDDSVLEMSSPRSRGRGELPWKVCGEEELLVQLAKKVFQRYAMLALEASLSPFESVKDALSERQRGSARQLAGVSRASKLVRDSQHIVVIWSLIKDAYVSEFIASKEPPLLDKSSFLTSVPAHSHVLVAFDALVLKTYGARSPDVSALSAFIADIFDRGCSLEVYSRYPLGGVSTGDFAASLGENRRTYRDERGKLRSVHRKKEVSGAVSFEAALDPSGFERLVQMLSDGQQRLGTT